MEEQIAQDHWMTFLNDFNKTHHGYEASIEIVGRDFGDQEETAWLPFSGISYDSHHHQILKRASTNSRKRGLTSG